MNEFKKKLEEIKIIWKEEFLECRDKCKCRKGLDDQINNFVTEIKRLSNLSENSKEENFDKLLEISIELKNKIQIKLDNFKEIHNGESNPDNDFEYGYRFHQLNK